MTVMHVSYVFSAAAVVVVFFLGYWIRALRGDGVRTAGTPSAVQAARASTAAAEIVKLAAERDRIAAESEGFRRGLSDAAAAKTRTDVELGKLRAEAARCGDLARELTEERVLRQEAEQAHFEARASLQKATQELGETRQLLASERAQRGRSEQEAMATRAAARRVEGECAKLVVQLDAAQKKARASNASDLELAKVREENNRLRADHARQREELGHLGDEHARLRAERDELAKATASTPHADLDPDVLKARLEMAMTQIQRIRTEDAERKEELQRRERELADVRGELDALSWRAAELDVVRSENESLQMRIDELTEELGKIQSRLAEATAQLEAAEARAIAADALAEQATQKRALAEAEQRNLRARVQAAEAQVREVDRLRTELQSLREHSEAAADAMQVLSVTQSEVRELRSTLQAAGPKLAEVDRLTNENQGLRQQVSELQENQALSGDLDRLANEHKRVRLECELATRRLQELEVERAELFDLRSQVQELSAVAAEVNELRRRAALLEAQLFSMGHSSGKFAIAEAKSGAVPAAGTGHLETALGTLVGAEVARTAVLADGQGLLIARAGHPDHEEGLAAFAGLADEFAARAKTLLPLGNVLQVSLQDANRVEAACRLFVVSSTEYGLVTLAPRALDRKRADEGVAAMVHALVAGRAVPAES